MPIYDYVCADCGATSEVFLARSDDHPECRSCGSEDLTKLLSAHSSMSGAKSHSLPGLGDTGCCGFSPGEAKGCAGPGSCCGRG